MMASPSMPEPGAQAREPYVLLLYVAGMSARSTQAVANT
jgi:hypothetical protein